MTRKEKDAERQEAIERLREELKPGDTVHTILRNVSRSGMTRSISIHIEDERGELWECSGLVGRVLDLPFDERRGGIKIGGCGSDMGWEITYGLAMHLFPDGFGCIGEGCPSNDHTNGDRDYTPHGSISGCRKRHCVCHDPSIGLGEDGCSMCGCRKVKNWHKSGGYALRHKWL